MWTTGATHMIARATGSTLFANSNVASIFGFDRRSLSTAKDQTSSVLDRTDDESSMLKKIRELRTLTPYAHFVKDNFHEMSKKYPNTKMTDISKKMSQAWKVLSEDEKKIYATKAAEQKIIYDNEKKHLSPADLQLMSEEHKSKKIGKRVKKTLQGLPTKKPRSAFIHYLSTLDRGEANIQDFVKGAAKRWAQLPVQEKQKFENLYYDEKEKYEKSLLDWVTKKIPQSLHLDTQQNTIKTIKGPVKDWSSSPHKEVKPRGASPKVAATRAPKSPTKERSKTKAHSRDSSSSDRESSSQSKKSNK